MKKIFKKIIIKIITWEAGIILKKYKPKIVAITGSVGKTSTKDMLFCVLSKKYKVRKSEKSYNSALGLPLTVLGLPNAWSDPFLWLENIFKGFLMFFKKQEYPDVLILEIGVSKPGDVKNNISKWLKIDFLLYTVFPDVPVHVEFFGSAENIFKEKSKIIKSLKKGGVLILNHDDEKVYSLHQKSKERVVSFGVNENATYKVSYPGYIYKKQNQWEIPQGVTFKFEYKGNTYPVLVNNLLGLHNTMQISGALACASEMGCDILDSISALSSYQNQPGRMSLLEGLDGSMIIDDSYNSSPIATIAAINVLREMKGNRKIVVLGDMLELGKHTEEEHRAIGKIVSSVADILITIGPRSLFVRDGAVENGFLEKNIFSFVDVLSSLDFVSGLVGSGDVVLVKGSQSMRLEKLVEVLIKDTNQKEKILCRQEKEWKDN